MISILGAGGERMFSLDLIYYVFAIIVVYIPFHLFEEAMGNFPLWMKEHKYMPVKISYGFWMAGNLFFYYPLLLTCSFLYLFAGKSFVFTGLAVLIWGGLNFFEHLFFTLKDRRISPGFFTSIIFLVICVTGVLRAFQLDLTTPVTMLLSFVIAVICAVLPAPMQKYLGNKLWKTFN
jgi:hypothetical protein